MLCYPVSEWAALGLPSRNDDVRGVCAVCADKGGLVDWYREQQESLKIDVADQGLATLVRMVGSGSVDISPRFQRRDRWKPEQQSRLVESFLRNIPIPPIYLAEDRMRPGRYAVIDGKQRLTAVWRFFNDKLTLSGIEFQPKLNGLRFSDLPEGLQEALGMKTMRVTTLVHGSNMQAQHEVFIRLNTGGEILNPQEIRNVAYSGRLNDAVYRMAENTFLRKRFKISETSKSPAYQKMVDAELVLRFFALSGSWREFKGSFRNALDEFMDRNRFADENDVEKLCSSFESAISTVQRIWGDDAFMRPGRKQSLAGMYDAQMLSVHAVGGDCCRIAEQHAISVRDALVKRFEMDRKLESSVRDATNTPEKLQYRVSVVMDILRGQYE